MTPAPALHTFALRTAEVLRDVPGLTYRILDYWIRCGVIAPAVHHGYGSGDPHAWDPAQVPIVAVMFRLNRLGADHNTLRLVAETLEGAQADEGRLPAWLVVHPGRLVEVDDPADLAALAGDGAWVLATSPVPAAA